MNDKIKSFMEYVSSDEALKAEMKFVTEGKSKAEQISNILMFAKKHNVDLAKDDIAPEYEELNEDELEAVVGGAGCVCAAYGQGVGDGLDCMCFIAGGGTVDNYYRPNSQGGCVCAVGGAGATRRH